jgi:hypothetical protein
LTIQATGKGRLTLNRLGHMTVKPTITFVPTNGTARSKSTSVALKKRR